MARFTKSMICKINTRHFPGEYLLEQLLLFLLGLEFLPASTLDISAVPVAVFCHNGLLN